MQRRQSWLLLNNVIQLIEAGLQAAKGARELVMHTS